jgi:hypothetical protein
MHSQDCAWWNAGWTSCFPIGIEVRNSDFGYHPFTHRLDRHIKALDNLPSPYLKLIRQIPIDRAIYFTSILQKGIVVYLQYVFMQRGERAYKKVSRTVLLADIIFHFTIQYRNESFNFSASILTTQRSPCSGNVTPSPNRMVRNRIPGP